MPIQARLEPLMPAFDIVPSKQLEVFAVQQTDLVKNRVVRVVLGPRA